MATPLIWTVGTVECRVSIINTVGIINDVGGSSELPPGRYRVQLVRTWNDYEIGTRAEGVLLDEADIEVSRQAGTTSWTAEHYEREYPSSGHAERVRAAKEAFDPTRVFFALSDFTKEGAMTKTTTIELADGVEVAIGAPAFNYYGMKRGRFDGQLDDAGWGWFTHDDGTRDLLNGERVCSLAHAQKMGWLAT